jgi:hypothetical protein
MRLWLVLLVACGTTARTPRTALESIPEAAAAALRRAAGGAAIEEVEREGDLYEGRWQVDGLAREAEVTASGELMELEEEVPSDQVPAQVRAMAIVKLPNAQSIRFSRLMRGKFEAEAIIDGIEREIVMTADGREVAD